MREREKEGERAGVRVGKRGREGVSKREIQGER